MRRPGFISPLSLVASALVVVVVVVITWLAGGILFSPGPLSARTSGHLPLKVLSRIAQTVRQTSGLTAEVF